MAVYSESRNGARIQVWLIHPLYDTAGQVNGLKADCLSSFAADPEPSKIFLSISRSFFGYLSRLERETKGSVVLIDWEEANGQEDFRKIPTRVVSSHDVNNCEVGCFPSSLKQCSFSTSSSRSYRMELC